MSVRPGSAEIVVECVPSRDIDQASSSPSRAHRPDEPITHDSAGADRIAALFVQLNAIAVRLDRAVADDGYGAYSGNSAIGVMTLLSLDGPRRPMELAAETGLSSGGLTLLVKRLERDGVVTVERGGLPTDRRAAVVALTSRGEAIVDEISDCVERTIETMSDDLHVAVDLLGEVDRRAATVPPLASGVHRMLVMARAGADVAAALSDPGFADDPTAATTALVLCCVRNGHHTRPTDLVPVVALSPSGVTQLLDRIEAYGMVTRDTGVTGDDREITLGLTPIGERSLAARLERLDARSDALATFLEALLAPLR